MKVMRKFYALFILVFLIAGFQKAKACHGLALMSLTDTVTATDITFYASSDPSSCGCGPYFIEAEVIPSTASFSGNPPIWTSPAWGTAPWFHALLNIPNYGPPSWNDQCTLEPYVLNIPYSLLCAGTTFKIRMREYVAGSSSAGPWTFSIPFTTPGITPTVSVTATSFASAVCLGDSTQLNAAGTGCTGPYDYSWSPTTGLNNAFIANPVATPSTTITYTVTFTDYGLGQTATNTITIQVSNPTSSLTSVIESTCNGSDGSAAVSASGGISPYSYLWNNSSQSTTAAVSGLPLGNYFVVITDAAGCTVIQPVFVGDSCNFVWPGDANDDAIANNFDILDIGIANGANGTTRPNATLNWIGQPSTAWGQTLMSGTDYKWVDCNGNGTINASDTTAVILNYGFIHNNRNSAPEHFSSAPDLSLLLVPDSLTPNSAGLVKINLGSSVQQATNIYGVAFTINFDPAQIDPQSIGFSLPSSWLGTPGTDLMGIKYSLTGYGRADVAITRLDHVNRNGFGQIATLYFNTTGIMAGTGSSVLVPFTISAIRVISYNEASVPVNAVNDTLTVYDPLPLGINSGSELQNFQVSPNPNDGHFNLSFYSPAAENYSIQIVDMLGQQIDNSEIKNVQGNFNRDIVLPNIEGIYFVRVISSDGKSISKRILIQ
jgi:hypothetical protein